MIFKDRENQVGGVKNKDFGAVSQTGLTSVQFRLWRRLLRIKERQKISVWLRFATCSKIGPHLFDGAGDVGFVQLICRRHFNHFLYVCFSLKENERALDPDEKPHQFTENNSPKPLIFLRMKVYFDIFYFNSFCGSVFHYSSTCT